MAIPPFPSEDLAKLVLGYLAEEQLMTAYDEFLQASPYLDAMYNEYDRIFMTSLKSILAEYRAVKIYVETCKPSLLRRKLLQCSNLLEMVRLLINHIDGNKLSTQEEIRYEKIGASNTIRSLACDVCNSLKLTSCICKIKSKIQTVSKSPPITNQQETHSVNCVETTSLADLPGSNIKNRKKSLKVLEKGCALTQNYGNYLTSEPSSKQPSDIIANQNDCNSNEPPTIRDNTQKPVPIALDFETTELEPHVRQSQPRDVVSALCNKLGIRDKKDNSQENNIVTYSNKKRTTPTSFIDFASGVTSDAPIIIGDNQNGIVPDSSTSENFNIQSCNTNKKFEGVEGKSKPSLYLTIQTVNNNSNNSENILINTVNNYPYMNIGLKPRDHKVKILSDVKVNNGFKNNGRKQTNMTNNATSTPLMRKQNIVVNATPAHKSQLNQTQQPHLFSTDEIMAMPTIIVVPTSVGQRGHSHIQPVTSVTTSTTTPIHTTGKHASPIIINISPHPLDTNSIKSNLTKETINKDNALGLIKTVDVVMHQKNTSAPKEVATSSADISTPLILPVTRKSSSTPRRSSHIRVLDFTTPRRILDETMIGQGINDDDDSSVEIISVENHVTETRFVNNLIDESVTKRLSNTRTDIVYDNLQHTKEKPIVPIKPNWDSELRIAVTPNNEVYCPNFLIHDSKVKTSNELNGTKYEVSKKIKKVKTRLSTDDINTRKVEKNEVVHIKPTIHIKPATDRSTKSTYVDKRESENKQEKLLEEEHILTPEIDRITLQNVMDAKLNISDLLETPYKQVFYDIQMDTPRCLVPDLPGDPLSDIKIMNIPTPRFFDSPKITSATPSYSSRPTDYSSGGSYYKPDDQDFTPSSELKCSLPLIEENVKGAITKNNSSHSKTKSRPVRKCAKNVSYYSICNMKESNNKIDSVSSCSESVNKTSIDVEREKIKIKVSKNKSTGVSESKSDTKKSKKRKSPTRKEKPKSFMKIKPRRVTPIKETLSTRIRKKQLQSAPPNLHHKRTTGKDKNIIVAPVTAFVTTKSRRKSSTPRKLQCSQTNNSTSVHNSVEEKTLPIRDKSLIGAEDLDADELTSRWSDVGSQEVPNIKYDTNVANESDDISKIREYIETTISNHTIENDGVFQNDLIKRGFDIETARIIERDLLDTPPRCEINTDTVIEEATKSAGLRTNLLENTIVTPVNSNINELKPVQCDDDNDEVELSIHDCNDKTNNFLLYTFDDAKKTSTRIPVTLKDTFSMEVCIDDDLTVRLRATAFGLLYDLNENNKDKCYSTKETEVAVNSILNISRLYTPLKDSTKSQVYSIFDSTLTSIDTPLKANSPKEVVSEIVVKLEEEQIITNKTVVQQKKKRHLSECSDESLKDNKKARPDAQYLLSSANIQNIDIETVLKKLHGP